MGRIAAVGEGVSEERVGERVMVDFNIYLCDDDSLAEVDYIGHGRDGGFAEVTIVTTDQARPVRSELSDLELATFCADYFGGERMLNRVNLQAGERVLISGASGGVGSAVIQLCCVRGAIPVALTSRSKLDAARAIGAAAVMARDEEDLAGSVLAAIDGQPIDVVVDLVGGPLFPVLLRVLKPEGRYVA